MSTELVSPTDHPLLTAMGDASAALAKAGGLPVWSLDDSAAVTALDQAYALVAQANAVAMRLLAEVDRRGSSAVTGAPTTKAWLRHRQRLTPAQAKRDVSVAAALERGMSATGQALAGGRISLEQVAAIAQVLGQAPRSAGPEQLKQAETLLLEQAAQLDAVDLRRLGVYLWSVLDPEATDAEEGRRLAAQEARAFGRRRLALLADGDGGVWLSGHLDAEGAAVVQTALDPLAAPRPTDADGPDPRSGAQRNADALVELARRALNHRDLPAAGGEKPHLAITFDYDSLRARLGVGALDTGGPLSASTIRRLACDAMIIPAVLDTAGVPLDLGRRVRVVPPSLRRAVILRDRGCAFPGCTRPPSWCDAHHIVHWIRGGSTSLDNAVLLCGHHHRLIHKGDWVVQMGEDQRPEFLPPEWIDLQRKPLRNTMHGAGKP